MALRSSEKPVHTKTVLLPDGQTQRELTEDFKRFQEIRKMSYGAPRRNELMKLLETGFSFTVNTKHSIIIDNDPDIQRLLKKGKVEMYTAKVSLKCKHTYIRIKYVEKNEPSTRNTND